MNFNFYRETSITAREKVRIVETYSTLVTVSGKYLEKYTFKKVLKKIDEIRRIIRIKIHQIYIYNYHIYIFHQIDQRSILTDSLVITQTKYQMFSS